MGDNRTDSEDSRYFGPDPREPDRGQDGLRGLAARATGLVGGAGRRRGGAAGRGLAVWPLRGPGRHRAARPRSRGGPRSPRYRLGCGTSRRLGRPDCRVGAVDAGTLACVPFLSPAKLLVILVVALIVLGPDKLPKVAKQIGGLWGDFRKFRERLESDVRGTLPRPPSTETITQAVRSPLSFLDNLADSHTAENGDHIRRGQRLRTTLTWKETPCSHPRAPTGRPAPCRRSRRPGDPGVLITDPGGIVHQVRSSGGVVPDDPGIELTRSPQRANGSARTAIMAISLKRRSEARPKPDSMTLVEHLTELRAGC